MTSKRVGNRVSTSVEQVEDSPEVKRPRGRPCKPRFCSSEFCLKPQGVEGGPKRTPQHIGDPYAHFERYEVDNILALCLKHGIEHFKVSSNAFYVLYQSGLLFLL